MGLFNQETVIQVGQIYTLKNVTCLENPPGTKCVCYEVYRFGNRGGASFIFENGKHDGFSEDEIAKFLEYSGFCEDVEDYEFTNVTQLREDFNREVFAMALRK